MFIYSASFSAVALFSNSFDAISTFGSGQDFLLTGSVITKRARDDRGEKIFWSAPLSEMERRLEWVLITDFHVLAYLEEKNQSNFPFVHVFIGHKLDTSPSWEKDCFFCVSYEEKCENINFGIWSPVMSCFKRFLDLRTWRKSCLYKKASWYPVRTCRFLYRNIDCLLTVAVHLN